MIWRRGRGWPPLHTMLDQEPAYPAGWQGGDNDFPIHRNNEDEDPTARTGSTAVGHAHTLHAPSLASSVTHNSYVKIDGSPWARTQIGNCPCPNLQRTCPRKSSVWPLTLKNNADSRPYTLHACDAGNGNRQRQTLIESITTNKGRPRTGTPSNVQQSATGRLLPTQPIPTHVALGTGKIAMVSVQVNNRQTGNSRPRNSELKVVPIARH